MNILELRNYQLNPEAAAVLEDETLRSDRQRLSAVVEIIEEKMDETEINAFRFQMLERDPEITPEMLELAASAGAATHKNRRLPYVEFKDWLQKPIEKKLEDLDESLLAGRFVLDLIRQTGVTPEQQTFLEQEWILAIEPEAWRDRPLEKKRSKEDRVEFDRGDATKASISEWLSAVMEKSGLLSEKAQQTFERYKNDHTPLVCDLCLMQDAQFDLFTEDEQRQLIEGMTLPQMVKLFQSKNREFCGVYLMTNNLTGQTYVGQSQELKKRINQHTLDSFLQVDQDLHAKGADFSVRVLEFCDRDSLAERESFYMKSLGAISEGGYNKNRTTRTGMTNRLDKAVIYNLWMRGASAQDLNHRYGIDGKETNRIVQEHGHSLSECKHHNILMHKRDSDQYLDYALRDGHTLIQTARYFDVTVAKVKRQLSDCLTQDEINRCGPKVPVADVVKVTKTEKDIARDVCGRNLYFSEYAHITNQPEATVRAAVIKTYGRKAVSAHAIKIARQRERVFDYPPLREWLSDKFPDTGPYDHVPEDARLIDFCHALVMSRSQELDRLTGHDENVFDICAKTLADIINGQEIKRTPKSEHEHDHGELKERPVRVKSEPQII